jgi:selenium metabolism protein YedF
MEEMMRVVDARGKPCPQPLLMTRKAMGEGVGELTVMVDNEGSAENVRRFAGKSGYSVTVRQQGGDFLLDLRDAGKGRSAPEEETLRRDSSFRFLKNRSLLIPADSLGRGSEELGRILLKALLNTLAENEVLPGKIILINAGVKLACDDPETVEALQGLESRGVEVLACGTCLDYYELTEDLKAGRISNAHEILNVLLEDSTLSWS